MVISMILLRCRLTEPATSGIDSSPVLNIFVYCFLQPCLNIDMLRFHTTEKGISIAEILPETETIGSAGDLLDILADAGYNGSTGLIVHSGTLSNDFFDLKTGLAGEILQKFSNYRMRLAIIGDFTDVKSKAMRDFIRESNTRGTINFVATSEEAIARLNR